GRVRAPKQVAVLRELVRRLTSAATGLGSCSRVHRTYTAELLSNAQQIRKRLRLCDLVCRATGPKQNLLAADANPNQRCFACRLGSRRYGRQGCLRIPGQAGCFVGCGWNASYQESDEEHGEHCSATSGAL